jgi:hypothetical protein
MTVRIGGIEFSGVQDLRTLESRTLVEQRAPEQQGSVFQDLGREPVTIVMEGLLFTAEALPDLEKLRDAQLKGEPLSFAADIAVGTELTQVVVEDLQVRQLAGYQNRYRYSLRLREYKEPPQSAAAATAGVDQGVAADAQAWSADSLAAADVLENPASLPAVLEQQPGVLEHLGAAELGASISAQSSLLSGKTFSAILGAVKKIDPAKVLALVQAIRECDSLGDFLQKCLDEGVDLLGDLSGIDLGKAGSLLRALSGGFEFLQKLKEVGEAGAGLLEALGSYDPLSADVQALFTDPS